MCNRTSVQFFAALLAILISGEPVCAQQSQTIVVGPPIEVSSFNFVLPNPVVPQDFSQGATPLITSAKPTFTAAPIILGASGTPGSCASQFPAANIIKDCSLGSSKFETNMVNLWLGIHGLPQSDASLIYQYGGIDLRSELRSFMFAYLLGVINETPAQLAANPNDQAAYNWLQNAVKQNEIAYYNAAVNEYYKWQANLCQFQLNSIVAKAFGLKYNGAAYCGASLTGAFSSGQAPDVSYFREVGQLTAYDSKVSAYDGTIANSAVTGAQIMLQAQEQISKWSGVIALGPSLALGVGAAGIVAGNISAIAPFANFAGDAVLAEGATAEVDEQAAAIGGGIIGADIVGAAGVVAIFVEIGVVAVINQIETDLNKANIATLIATNNTIASQTPNLQAMLMDQVGYQKILETFIAATLPDLPSTQGVAAPPIPSMTDPANAVFYGVALQPNIFSSGPNTNLIYITWDPKYPPEPGNPPFANYGQNINASSYGDGWFVQQGALGTFFSPTIKYIDPTSGIHYIADRIDKGRFLVSKAPDQVSPGDVVCPVNRYGVIPYTTIPTYCSSFVTKFLNVLTRTDDPQTVTIPQPPVFSTPSSFNFTVGGTAYQTFSPHLDGSSSPYICGISAGTLPPGFVFTNNLLYINDPPQVSPGTYQINFMGYCNYVPGYATLFGNAETTQTFTAIVSSAASAAGTTSAVRISRDSTLSPASVPSSALQFNYPTATTSLTFTQGRSTTLTVTTNGGPGTTITVGANALPPGMTLTDNGNGTAVIAGIPTGPFSACSSGCAITASAPGLTSATLTLNANVVAPQLPNIPASQNVNWPAGQNSILTVDGSTAANNTPTSVALSWSAVAPLPSWATLTDNGNNIVTFSGTPPASAVNQTIALQYQYTYGGTPGFSSPAFVINVTVGAPNPLLSVSPILLFEVGAPGSGTVNSSTVSGAAGLSGNFQVNAVLPTGLTSSQNGTSLTISGIPVDSGNFMIPIEFSAGGQSTTRNVAMMVTQPASLSGFPPRLVLFAGVPANIILPLTAGFPLDPAGSPGDGLPSTTGANLSLSPGYSGGNGLTVSSNGASLSFTGTPVAPATPASFTASAQIQLSTGPVGSQVSQPFLLYVQPAGDVNLDGAVNCLDYDLIKAHYGAILGQSNYLDLADPNHDGLVNILDLAFVQSHLPKGTVCQ